MLHIWCVISFNFCDLNVLSGGSFFAWTASTASSEFRLNNSFVVDNSRRHYRYDKEKINWDQHTSKNTKCLDWHNRTKNICKESYSSGARCNCHSPNPSSKWVSHSFFHVSLNDLLPNKLALLPSINKHKYIICSDSYNKEDSNDL